MGTLQRFMKIVESMMLEDKDPDWDYYLTEGCGIFALALSRVFPGGDIIVISNTGMDAEPWSEYIDFEVTHVVYRRGDSLYDVEGKRTLENILKDFRVSKHQTRIYKPVSFQNIFVGDGDEYPLYGSEKDIKEAVQIIRSNLKRFGAS